MGRMYSVVFENVSVALAQDFFELTPADDKPILIHEIVIAAVASETAEQLRFTVKRFSGAYTGGSGGSTPTPNALDSDTTPAAGFTAEANNTTQATGGTSKTLRAEGADIRNGYRYYPVPEDRIGCKQGEAIVVSLAAAPGQGATTMSGTIIVEELGG